jgi:hypothetical protein
MKGKIEKSKMIITYDDDDYYFTEPQEEKFQFLFKNKKYEREFFFTKLFFSYCKIHRNRVEKKR